MSEKHHCHALKCETSCPPRMFMCRPHWFRLPKKHQDAIWREYRKGQEISKTPSWAYRIVQAEAVLCMAILDNLGEGVIQEEQKFLDWLLKKNEKYAVRS